MNQPSSLQRVDELFERLEIAGAGLFALGNLVRQADQQHLDETILSGIGCLLETLSSAVLDASCEGYKHTRSKQPLPE